MIITHLLGSVGVVSAALVARQANSLASLTQRGDSGRELSRADTVIIRPSDTIVRGSRIHPYTAHWNVTYQTPDGKTLQGGSSRTVSWYDTVRISMDGGRRILHRRQTLYAPDSVRLEVIDNWADAATLAPIGTELRQRNQPTATRHFDNVVVTGSDPDSTSTTGVRAVNVRLPERVFDFYGGLFDVFLAALPLRPGLVLKFPTDDPSAKEGSGLLWTSISVIGRESIATASRRGTVETWRVEAPGAGNLGAHFVFWIADDAPYLVRMWYVGPRGGKQVWDIT